MRSRAFRRHQTERHMRRRLSEDRNQHYDDLSCPCWGDPRIMARFKEQPARDWVWRCWERRQLAGRTVQERRAGWE
jgi:hypothetical protein